ncbi:MAG TPA: phage tail protein, partial [Acidimicrobiales bacterium]|nr:phage tail protein [Acidimicrobiales bacterium]
MAPDTYAQFAYCVKWDGRYVAGFRHAYGLKRNTVLVQRRDGADSAQADALPLHSTAGAITLEDGVTCDAAFARWASGGAAVMPSREDVTVEVHNEASQLETAFKVSGCWVSQFRALPDLDANANAVSIQSLMLQHEGWERDDTVTEPAERGFALSERFEQAVTWVAHIHSGHVRKGSDVPYVSHLFAVSSLVLEDGGDE